jgi:hypothetical protein
MAAFVLGLAIAIHPTDREAGQPHSGRSSPPNAWAGYDKEAKDAAAQLQKVYPGFTVQTWAGMHWSDDPTWNMQVQRITEGLRKAGLPEGEAKTN